MNDSSSRPTRRPGADLPVVRLKTERNSRHPWIFAKMIRASEERIPPGSLVEVRDRDGGFVGRGFYHSGNTLAVRLLSEDPGERIDAGFFRRRLSAAKELREQVLRLPERGDSYRLVHAEADGLSGLVVDKFADVLLAEPFSAGILFTGDLVAEALADIYPGCRLAFRASQRTETRECVSFAELAAAHPAPRRVQIRENGLRFSVDFGTGHKTGFFLDQRDNRAAVSGLARGLEVFDLCCYTGGFALSALAGGAARVTAVDLDEEALVTARENAKLNGVERARLELIHQNAFDFLRDAAEKKRQADLVILDPAKLALVKEEVPRAMRTYGDLNRLAVRAVRPGGLLVTCSCSGLVPEDTFRSVVSNAAAEAGCELQIFAVRGAAPDHPVSSVFPEGRYLKVLFARVLPRASTFVPGRAAPAEE